jgi:hypothetical protein
MIARHMIGHVLGGMGNVCSMGTEGHVWSHE